MLRSAFDMEFSYKTQGITYQNKLYVVFLLIKKKKSCPSQVEGSVGQETNCDVTSLFPADWRQRPLKTKGGKG